MPNRYQLVCHTCVWDVHQVPGTIFVELLGYMVALVGVAMTTSMTVLEPLVVTGCNIGCVKWSFELDLVDPFDLCLFVG